MFKRNMSGKKKGLKFHKPGRLLVFESTGFALYGALARCGLKSPLTVSEPVVSTDPDFAGAVGAVLEQLRQKLGKRLPKKAILITPSAASGLLYLPVDPEKPRTKAQMSDMVRWELEESFVQQNDIWSQGSLLMGRGYISAELRREMEGGAGARPRSSGGAYHELVSSAHIDECLDLQEQLTTSDDELVTGWTPQAGKGEEGPFTWWGAGIGDGVRGRWVHAFRKHGLALSWIYPQLGTAVAALAPEPDGWLLVEIRQEQFGLFQERDGLLTSLALKSSPCGLADPVAVADAVQGLLLPDTQKIYLSAPAALASPLLAVLGQRFGRQVATLAATGTPAGAGSCPPEILASLQGAARHGLGLCPPPTLVRIQAQPPAPALWKHKEIYPWLVIVVLLAAIAANEWYLRSQAAKNEWALEMADIEYERRKKMIQEAQQTTNEVKRLQGELAAKQGELAEQLRLRNILDNVIRYRQELVPGILQAIGAAVSDEVVMDLLEEKGDRSGFYLEGWALRDTEGQLFVKRLNENLLHWKYKVGEMQLARGMGRLKIDGFILKIWMVKVAEKKEAGND